MILSCWIMEVVCAVIRYPVFRVNCHCLVLRQCICQYIYIYVRRVRSAGYK